MNRNNISSQKEREDKNKEKEKEKKSDLAGKMIKPREGMLCQ